MFKWIEQEKPDWPYDKVLHGSFENYGFRLGGSITQNIVGDIRGILFFEEIRPRPTSINVYVNGGKDKQFSGPSECITLVDSKFISIDDAKEAMEESLNLLSEFIHEIS